MLVYDWLAERSERALQMGTPSCQSYHARTFVEHNNQVVHAFIVGGLSASQTAHRAEHVD